MIDLSEIERRLLPDEELSRKLSRVSQDLISKIRIELERDGIQAEPLLVGSVSKGTFLDPDIDIFISFDRKYEKSFIVSTSLRIGHRVLSNGTERYAEHPYVTGSVSGIKVDIVPCYRIKKGETIITAVDRSPLHTRYILEALPEEKKSQVRLLKAFMKHLGIYGSEVSTKGFSGYVCELLIIRNGDFIETIRSFSQTKGRYIISDGAIRKFKDPVVIVDPVDGKRNAAAAVSVENLSLMKIASREFLLNPSDEFFFGTRTRKKVPMERGTHFRIFRLPLVDAVPDTLYPQVDKFRRILVKLLDDGGFIPLGSEIHMGESIDILVELRFLKSPRFRIHRGPPADSERTHDFIEKWIGNERALGPYLLGDRLFVEVPTQPESVEEYILNRIGKRNIGKNLNPVKSKLSILKPSPSEEFEVLTKYFSRVVPIHPRKPP